MIEAAGTRCFVADVPADAIRLKPAGPFAVGQQKIETPLNLPLIHENLEYGFTR
jgi:hypothetical protein